MAVVYAQSSLGAYGFSGGHPFGTDRLAAFWKETQRQGLDKKISLGRDFPPLCDDALARFHSPDYIALVKRQSQTGEGYLDAGDTPAFSGVYEITSGLVAAGLQALDEVMTGQDRRVFLPIAGLHHARRDQASGFCVFNDIGVLIETLRSVYNVQRIAYVDIDAHHGDGVFYAYQDDPNLIFVDLHEDGRFLYPGTGSATETGTGAAKGCKLNIPLAPGANDQVFLQHWPRVESFIREAQPEIILLQAGADSIAGDPLTHLEFSPDAHAHAAARLCRVADEFCDGRFIAFGGGGYNRQNLALGWNAVLKEMISN